MSALVWFRIGSRTKTTAPQYVSPSETLGWVTTSCIGRLSHSRRRYRAPATTTCKPYTCFAAELQTPINYRRSLLAKNQTFSICLRGLLIWPFRYTTDRHNVHNGHRKLHFLTGPFPSRQQSDPGSPILYEANNVPGLDLIQRDQNVYRRECPGHSTCLVLSLYALSVVVVI